MRSKYVLRTVTAILGAAAMLWPQTAPTTAIRACKLFDPKSGRTVMLAVDHGYFQGPTTGLERIDLSIVPLLPDCDALFCTRGILRSLIPAECQKPMVLRASGGPSVTPA